VKIEADTPKVYAHVSTVPERVLFDEMPGRNKTSQYPMRRLALMAVSVMAAMCTAPAVALAADTTTPSATGEPSVTFPSVTLPTVQIVVGRRVLGSQSITELTHDLAAGSATVIMTRPIVDQLPSVSDTQLRDLAAASRTGILIVPGHSGLLARKLQTDAGRVATYDSAPELKTDLAAQPVSLSAAALAGLLVPAPQRIGRGLPATVWCAAALALALLAVAALRLRRRSAPPEPPPHRGRRLRGQNGTEPFLRPAKRRSRPAMADEMTLRSGLAIVRSELDPEGYVELDGCLRRVRWTDSGRATPRPGERVDVQTDHGRLVALSCNPTRNGVRP
jgi:hypothetical protein